MPGEERQHLDLVTLRRLGLLDPNRLLHRLSDVRVGAMLGVEVKARDELVAGAVGLADAARTARGVGLVGHPACQAAALLSIAEDSSSVVTPRIRRPACNGQATVRHR